MTGVHTLSVKGETAQLHAVVTFADGSTQDLTSEASWASSNRDVATVTATGMVTAIRDGRAMVTAGVRGLSDAKVVIVDLPVADGI